MITILDPRTLHATQTGRKLKIYLSNISNIVWGLFDQCANSNTGSCLGQCPVSCCYSANEVISNYLG